jgi:hypothetical protein
MPAWKVYKRGVAATASLRMADATQTVLSGVRKVCDYARMGSLMLWRTNNPWNVFISIVGTPAHISKLHINNGVKSNFPIPLYAFRKSKISI